MNGVDKIYCINLDRRTDRWYDIQKQFEKHGLEVERFSAINGLEIVKQYPTNIGNSACAMSHYFIIERARMLGFKSIMVFEDDAVLHDDFTYLLSWIMENELPDDADILYLGGSHRKPPIKYSKHIMRVIHTLTTHGYIMRDTIFARAAKEIRKLEQPIDGHFVELQRIGKVYITNPPLAWQGDGYSDIENREMSYPWIKTNEQ